MGEIDVKTLVSLTPDVVAPAIMGDESATIKPPLCASSTRTPSTEPPRTQPRTLLQLACAITHPLLIFDAYTFRWLTFDPHDEKNNQHQAFTKVTNIGLISALILTVFASWLQALATTAFATYGAYESVARAISSAALSSGVIFLVMSVINSVLLLLAVNDAEDDHHATILLKKLGLWFTLPALYFYLGVLIGTLGWFVWIPAVFALEPALFIVAVGFVVGIGINAGYYQFIVLSVYEARAECGMSIPGPPALFALLAPCSRRKPLPKVSDTTKPLVDPHNTTTNAADTQADARRALERALRCVGRPELLAKAIEDEWDHVVSLQGMEESHAVAWGLKPGAAVRFIRSLRHELKLTRKS